MIINGFYILKDEFFSLVNEPYLKDNKDGNRPFYYCIEEEINGIKMYWMIPLSSRVEKYKNIIAKKKAQHKPTDGLYICKLPNDKQSAFLIQDMFPVTIKYIEREYTINHNHLLLMKSQDIDAIKQKYKRVLRLIKNGVKLTPTSPDVNKIIKDLIKDSK